MSCVAIIPARGGSKGIPKKNISLVAGMPLIAYSILAAKQSNIFTEVYVSTDCKEIAEVAQHFGASIIHRPEEISGDFASSESAIIHSLQEIKANEEDLPDYTCFIQCTSPLIQASQLTAALSKLEKEKLDCIFAAAAFKHFIWNHSSRGLAGSNHDYKKRAMRQERNEEFIEAGSFYFFKTDKFLNKKHRFFGKMDIFEIPYVDVFEIDDPEELERAEIILKHRSDLNSFRIPKNIKALICDFDGVMTNNQVTVSESGIESVVCNRGDGMGIEMLKASGIKTLVLSKEKNDVVLARCKKMKIDTIHGCDDKLPLLKQWCTKNGLALEDVAYIGNDVNDNECLEATGCGIAVKDAHPKTKSVADVVLTKNGGQGAVREACDFILTNS